MEDSKPPRSYRYFDFVMAAFVTVLLCSNLIGAAKICDVRGYHFGAGVLFFPISYIFGDILTEVYGYARARRVVWAGFAAQIFASLMCFVVLALPPAPFWQHQAAYETVYGSTWRIVVASLVAYFCGEFMNSFTLARMKVKTEGKYLWMRTIGSTIVGEGIDSLIFYPIAFYPLGAGWLATTWTPHQVLEVMYMNYLIKVGWEVVITPITYIVVIVLKRVESEDYFDRTTSFNPFTLASN